MLAILGPLLAGVALIGALVGFVHMERKAGADAERVKWEPQVAACKASNKDLEGKLEAQNKAISELKAEGDRRVAAASKGIARARTEAKAAISEAERLRTASKSSAPPGACPAASAATELRRGLK